ncbi:E3 ubiquitin-protein ligase FANCL isoform X1 [Macadamia integrifolia]|uniref:E3 ubiquitin-protein ligase FANCL isoform X1 n=1 Tax=Macadamia integrifolia TaxID=60698 RepID=UPI001C4E5C16|nr:E3 ubiquitin-protein ligase FANCL isoform X1 [Macadamia integrifolia]
MALSLSFNRSVYSEVEEVGWEHLVRLGEDLTSLSFRILDKNGQVHIMEIRLPPNYPKFPPSISADVPYLFKLKWLTNSRLKDVVHQFLEHLEKFQDFWSTLENIDRVLWVVDPRQPSRATSYRKINLGNDCCIVLYINAYDPRSLPECRFLGPDSIVDSMRKKWRSNGKRWMKDKPFPENLVSVLEIVLPGPPDIQKDDQKFECGICYAQYLPIDDDLGAKSGSCPDYTCDNANCSRAFHSLCLGDWLRSITTTRQSFDVLFGSCPYCSEPVAVKVNAKV